MKRDTKEKILKAGTAAMLEKSYHAVGIKEILDAVGVPKGSFYHFFKSKEEFGIEIIDSFARNHAAMLQSFIDDRTKSPLERLKGSFLTCLNYYPDAGCENNCLIAKLSHEVMHENPDMRAAIRNAFDTWQSLYARMIREAQNSGEIDPGLDPEELASFIHNAWEGAVMMMQVYQNHDPVKNYITFVFENLLKSNGSKK